jgi:hypothetical protein
VEPTERIPWLDIINFKHQDAGLGEVTAKQQQDAIHHVIQEEKRMWEIRWPY